MECVYYYLLETLMNASFLYHTFCSKLSVIVSQKSEKRKFSYKNVSAMSQSQWIWLEFLTTRSTRPNGKTFRNTLMASLEGPSGQQKYLGSFICIRTIRTGSTMRLKIAFLARLTDQCVPKKMLMRRPSIVRNCYIEYVYRSYQ